MSLDTLKLIAIRSVAFSSTLILSLVIVNSMPRFKERRQRYFSEAAMDGSLHRLQLLHLAGANVNARANCCLPLFLAASEGRLEAVRYLLDEGAEVNAREKHGNTALSEATYYGHIPVIKELLVRGADINAVSDGGTALDIALSRNQTAVVDLLTHQGGKKAAEIR